MENIISNNQAAQVSNNTDDFKSIEPDRYFDHDQSVLAEKKVTVKARQAIVEEIVITHTDDGFIETRNIARTGDYIVSDLDHHEYVVRKKDFHNNYSKTGKTGTYKPIDRALEVMLLSEDVKFLAPWGEEMRIKSGGALINKGPNDIYGIQPDDFKDLYRVTDTVKTKKTIIPYTDNTKALPYNVAESAKATSYNAYEESAYLAFDRAIRKKIVTKDINLPNKPATPDAPNDSTIVPKSAKGHYVNASASAAGLALGIMGLRHSIQQEDTRGIIISSADIAVSSLELAIDTAPILGKVLSPSLRGFATKANILVAVADGAYQISREEGLDNKFARAGAVTATTGTAIAIGSTAATIAGGGAVAAGATVAAPIIAAISVGMVTDSAVEAYKITEHLDDMFKKHESAIKRSNETEISGAPKLSSYLNLRVFATNESTIYSENGEEVTNIQEKSKFVSSHSYSKDPDALNELSDKLDQKIADYNQLIDSNDSWVHDSIRFFWDSEEIDTKRQAQMDRIHYIAARNELNLYQTELDEHANINKSSHTDVTLGKSYLKDQHWDPLHKETQSQNIQDPQQSTETTSPVKQLAPSMNS